MKKLDTNEWIAVVVAIMVVWALLIFGGPLSQFNPFVFFFV